MLSIDALSLFIMTTFVVVLSPGPAVIAVTTEAATSGFSRSVWLIFGVAVANVIFFVLSATGIAALILTSSLLFSIIKWAGVAYLLYLGFGAIFRKPGPINFSPGSGKKNDLHKVFARGFALEIVNPKALLYFSALLPQFVDTTTPIVPQLAAFCLITFALDFACYSLYAYFGSRSMVFKNNPAAIKLINRLAGGMLVFIGMRMATFEL